MRHGTGCGSSSQPSRSESARGCCSRLTHSATRQSFCNVLANVEKIAKEIPSLEKIIVTPYVNEHPETGNLEKSRSLSRLLVKRCAGNRVRTSAIRSSRFYHVFIGDYGKTQMHGAGLRRFDKSSQRTINPYRPETRRQDFLYFFSQLDDVELDARFLSPGATVVLYDGNPNYPDLGTMWRLAQDEKITIFGCSASYLNFLRSYRRKS